MTQERGGGTETAEKRKRGYPKDVKSLGKWGVTPQEGGLTSVKKRDT